MMAASAMNIENEESLEEAVKLTSRCAGLQIMHNEEYVCEIFKHDVIIPYLFYILTLRYFL